MTGCDESALVAAAAAGRSLDQIAVAAGASKSTVQRRLRDPEVKAELQELRLRSRERAMDVMAALRDRAMGRLDEILGCEDDALALRAVNLVLSTSPRFDLAHDLDVRITSLEAEGDAEIAARVEAGVEAAVEEAIEEATGEAIREAAEEVVDAAVEAALEGQAEALAAARAQGKAEAQAEAEAERRAKPRGEAEAAEAKTAPRAFPFAWPPGGTSPAGTLSIDLHLATETGKTGQGNTVLRASPVMLPPDSPETGRGRPASGGAPSRQSDVD
jgi:hypothetical protein